MEQKYLNLKQLVEFTGINGNTIRWLVHKKKIPYLKLTEKSKSRLFFDKKEIERWLERPKQKSPE